MNQGRTMNSIQKTLIQHLIHPFSVEKKSIVSLNERIAIFAAALFVGIAAAFVFNAGVGIVAGFAIFYVMTLYQKSRAHPSSTQPKRETLKIDQLQSILKPAIMKNIQAVAKFGDWQEMGYRTEVPAVRSGREYRLLEKIATEMPELGQYLFFNKRGNGECGYRTLVDGILWQNCIRTNRVDELQGALQKAYETLIGSWNKLPFSANEKGRFGESLTQAREELEKMKSLSNDQRVALLQDESFLAPFLTLARCLIVSQTKCLSDAKIDVKVEENTKKTNECLAKIKKECDFNDEQIEHLSYALGNYPLSLLLGDAELPNKRGNDKQNLVKGQIKETVQKANRAKPQLLNEIMEYYDTLDELANQELILGGPIAEYLELGIDLEEFLKRKALGNADSPRPYWALGSDFTALGYALNMNICCIFRDAAKDNAYDVVKTYKDRPADFYGLNLTGQAHFNVLLPL